MGTKENSDMTELLNTGQHRLKTLSLIPQSLGFLGIGRDVFPKISINFQAPSGILGITVLQSGPKQESWNWKGEAKGGRFIQYDPEEIY